MRRTLIVFLAFVAVTPSLRAAEPAFRAIDLRGLQVGGTTTLTIDGDDLGKTPRLLLPFPAKQTLKAGNTDKRAIFDVTLADDVPAGYHHLRVVADGGVSLPIVIGVDRMLQQPTATPIGALPVALHGSVAGSAISEVKFSGKAKQRVLVEVEAQRFGSKLRPVVHLLSPKKLQLAWAWTTPSLFGDARLEATLPEDGVYTVTLHDAEYAAPAPGFFRLKIGEWSFVDQVFPPVIGNRQVTQVELLGTPGPVKEKINPKRLSGINFLNIGLPADGVWSGPQPFVTVVPNAEVVRQAATDLPQELPAGLVGVSGKLTTSFAEDQYRIQVAPGKKVKLEVFAERLGSPIDTALVVRNDKGVQLARAEDSPGTLDPVLEYQVPDKVTAITVGVVDAQGRAGPRGIYRLVVDPLTQAPSVKLVTTAQRLSLPIGGRVVVPVLAERRGDLGKIALAANVPTGVSVENATIPEGADGTLLSLSRGAGVFEPMIVNWRGGEQTVVIKNHPLERLQPWLASEIAIAPSAAKSDFTIDWRGLAADAALVPGSKLALPIKATRPADKTTVKLTLLTSQRVTLLNNAPDPNKSLRQEKPIEMPVKASDSEITLLVPVELPAPVYDVTVQADLLDPAKKVLATAYAPVRRMSVKLPIVVKLSGSGRIEAKREPKKPVTFKLQGKIERLSGVKADVVLALTGLPTGAKAEAVTLKGGAADFTINVTLPPTVPAGAIKGLKLSGSYAPNPAQANIRVKSREVELTLILTQTK